MPTLTIRNVPERVHRAIRRRAAENARSVEAEVRALLETAATAPATDWRREIADIQSKARKALGDPPKGAVAEDAIAFQDADDPLPSAIGLWGQSPPGQSEVDRFIAQRRVEAAYEGDEISSEEFADLNRRIDAWEIDADGIDQLLAQRRGQA
jgi:plasmid stability protein